MLVALTWLKPGLGSMTAVKMTERIPFQIREAVVSVCVERPSGLRIHSAGFYYPVVFQQPYTIAMQETKFKIARHILAELDGMNEKRHSQRNKNQAEKEVKEASEGSEIYFDR